MTDWLGMLGEAMETGDAMRRQVPETLADPDIGLEQVKSLFAALEQQAQFCETLKTALERLGYDFAVVDKAGALEELYADLAARAAETLKLMRGRDSQRPQGEQAGAAEEVHAALAPVQPAGRKDLPSGR
jgi:hypothetical protein